VTVVQLDKLCKTYPGSAQAALDNLSLEIASGELVFNAQSIAHQPPERRNASMVFQNHLLFKHLTVFDNVAFGLKMRGQASATIEENVIPMLERVQLAGMGKRLPHELSGGQQQRVALARALVTRPNVLLLDEPLSSLDADLRVAMRKLIRQLQQELQVTTLLVTHDQQDALAVADRVALLMQGELKQYAPAVELLNKPKDAVTARFFGGCNFISGALEGNQFRCTAGALTLSQEALEQPALKPVIDRTSNLLATIRPEDIQVVTAPVMEQGVEPVMGQDAANIIETTLISASENGNFLTLDTRHSDISLAVICHRRDLGGLQPDDTVRLNLPTDALWLLPPEA